MLGRENMNENESIDILARKSFSSSETEFRIRVFGDIWIRFFVGSNKDPFFSSRCSELVTLNKDPQLLEVSVLTVFICCYTTTLLICRRIRIQMKIWILDSPMIGIQIKSRKHRHIFFFSKTMENKHFFNFCNAKK